MLDPEQEELFSRHPNEPGQRLAALSKRPAWVLIDEVQRAPRAKRLHPHTPREAGKAFDLDEALSFGTLSKAFGLDEESRTGFLRSYTFTSLKEEIASEQILRRLEPFREFLEVAAQANGTILNYSTLARDVGVDYKTVQSYFEILEDTLIGFHLPAFHESLRKRQAQHPKIDLILDRPGEPRVFMEINSGIDIRESDCANLARMQADSKQPVLAILATRAEAAKKIGMVLCLPWRRALEEIGL